MLRLGSLSPKTRQMDLDDIFLSRLKLLIIMAKAYLKNVPIGKYRREAILENAHHIESESIDLGNLDTGFHCMGHTADRSAFDHVFYQRVKLLAVMMRAAAKGFPMGDIRRTAMRQNLDIICEALTFTNRLEDMAFLMVA